MGTSEPIPCRCEELEKEERPLRTIMWAAEAFAHPNSPKAQRLIEVGAAQAARYYLEGNDLGLLMMSGMSREQFYHRMSEMTGTLEKDWHKWRDKEP
jgi:hypothetical protein